MPFYYSGINNASLFSKQDENPVIIDQFTEINFPGLTDIEIGWNFLLLWKDSDLYILEKITGNKDGPKLLKIPDFSGRCKAAQAGMETVVILTENGIWLYKVHEKTWKKVPNFIFSDDESQRQESITKIVHARCTVALTNLGRVFNIPTLVDIPKRIKFTDIACGFDHTILLAENGDVYSMGMGTRGQLGHGDLEDCDNPKCIEALAGLKVVEIAAGGWHSAAITEQGDLYTWGWNTNGELGIDNDESKICGTPMVVDFKNDGGEIIEMDVKKVQCGNNFTICMLEWDGEREVQIWGCGSNKYGQLGQSDFKGSQIFVKLNVKINLIKDLKCREWGTCIITQ